MAFPDEQREWEAVAAALTRGELPGGAPVEAYATHISVVTVVGDRVYKLKRPLRVGPVDYSTRARRREMCLRELEANRRLGGPLYERVVGVRRGATGFELCVADDPRAVEHLVVTRYVPRDRMLHVRVDRRDEVTEDVKRLGTTIGRFHADAPLGPASAGSPDAVMTWVRRLIERLHAGRGVILDARLEALGLFFERWGAVNRPRLEARAADGWIRRVHGDLRLEHVVLGDPLLVMDAVEFDETLSTIDVLSDLAFLVMELQLGVREDLTRFLVDAWQRETRGLDAPLLWFYASARALVRAAVHLERHHQLPPGDAARSYAADLALSHVRLATRLSWRARRPRAVIFAGLSGSGKSSLSAELAQVWGLERWSSDVTRKRLIGLGHNQVAPSGAYDQHVSRDVYARLGREAGREVAADRSVVVDATFRRREDAQAFVHAFRGAGATEAPVVIGCHAEESTLRRRLAERADRAGSDADVQVLERQLEEGGPRQWGISGVRELDTSRPREATLREAERLVLEATV